jgi:hypothetical protein
VGPFGERREVKGWDKHRRCMQCWSAWDGSCHLVGRSRDLAAHHDFGLEVGTLLHEALSSSLPVVHDRAVQRSKPLRAGGDRRLDIWRMAAA